MRSVRAALLALALALPSSGAEGPAASDGGAHRFALCIGNTAGGTGTRPLRYAERDARRIYDILVRLGGVRREDARLLLGSTADEARTAIADLDRAIGRAQARGEATQLVIYYSGHAKDGDLRLGDSRLPLSELRAALTGSPADVRIGLLDSCQSGAITRAKGLREAPTMDVDKLHEAAHNGPRGLVLIASSAADEESQESDEINASFFTHYLATGLMGDADASGDGKVTLAEAYAYAYGRTLGATASTHAGAQHPVYQFDLGGAGDVILTELRQARGGLVLPASSEGVFVVLDGTRRAIAEVAKTPGNERKLALAPGKYLVKKRLDDALLVGDVEIDDRLIALDESAMRRRPLDKDPQKGAAGARWSLNPSLTYQYFFDSAARTGLFPPALLVGVDLQDRDDLGHQLGWGLDVATGGGSANLALSDQPSVHFTFGELNGGGALWRDFYAGDFTFSLGGRVGFVYLHRSFDNRPDLQSQYFFTLTPGLQASVSWRFADRWRASVRGRFSYLFYNVDKSQSLGFADLGVGVDYAFGE